MQGIFQYNSKKYKVSVSLENADVEEETITVLLP